jgi:lipid A ethanolaminephosphotransferase
MTDREFAGNEAHSRSVRSRWLDAPRPLWQLNLWLAVWFLVLLNAPFWQALWNAVGSWTAGRTGFLLSLPCVLLLWTWLILECLTWGRAAKPALGALVLLTTGAAYFLHSYGIAFDRGTIENIVQTDLAEALELVNMRLVGWLLFLALPALWLVWRIRVVRQPWYRALVRKAMAVGSLALALGVTIGPLFESYAPFLREHRELALKLVPWNYVAAVHGYLKVRLASPQVLERVGLDARQNPSPGRSKPRIIVLVIGETARAANFELNGYPRPTTPRLAAQAGLINFTHVRSCGTATAVSLPCMFLDVGRERFDGTLGSRRESLLDVLQRAGVSILWRDNNSGCKGVCDRVPREDLRHAAAYTLCAEDECYDEILLRDLERTLEAVATDTLIVLHMQGSHGPSYHLRYPPAFEYFTPVCRTNEFDRCEREAIVNAYDNTLRYTDHVLGEAIEMLRRNAGHFAGSLIYVSDHGESLGERGLYLHGMPYALAPAEQTHVPFLMWFSRDAPAAFGVDTACLRDRADEALSHDNLYHTVLGLMDIRTAVYRPDRDIAYPCRAIGDFVWDARLMDARSPVSRNAWRDFSVLGAGTRG